MIQYARVNQCPEVETLLARDAVVAVGVSGGKDSQACALAVQEHLNAIGHQGPRILVHSDLGRVEWKQSLPKCEEIAAALGWELHVVKRTAGDLMDRWLVRWNNNVARYANLESVKIILPWSTPTMRFCTSELKSAILNSYLRKTFPGKDIINVVGIRRQESAGRAKMPVFKSNPACAKQGGTGLTWNAIIDWKIEDVFSIINRRGLELHEGYTTYGMTRISCVCCIMASWSDLQASMSCEENHPTYREMVELELESTFSFQSNKWLADVNPAVLGAELSERITTAKAAAAMRESAEARIPKHLLYSKGWPTCIPSIEEAETLAEVRREVATLLGLTIQYTDASSVIDRFTELMELKPSNADEAVELIPTINTTAARSMQMSLL
jgi:3'-phosphoadenosine 5'-phosphosulfate sulfotransferase (PAPS reductase)/FAD synthetase